MSIKPLDLQTLFMQMGHVHKQQAGEKDSVSAGESYRRIEAEKRSSKEAKTVHAKEDSDIDAGQIKSSTEKEDVPFYDGRKHAANDAPDSTDEEIDDKEVVRDPGLGRNIDISG
ncbi:MAG: hypothetical protein KKI09_00400 [Spirochaetes bacterium]|nr:hypothetical protein [Spirochaetota bacterium]MBU0953858.1 hypothetical protein [Spirochaetota bacterium]